MQLPLWGSEDGEYTARLEDTRASLHREMRYLLTISTGKSSSGRLSPAGLAHSLGVCLIEEWLMARGKNGSKAEEGRAGLPNFVDVKLTQDQRLEFANHLLDEKGCVRFLASASDDGYRIGVSWSGEHQSYTVSMTCRNPQSPNFGLCMTAFAGELMKAISLANFKHVIVTEEVWVDPSVAPLGDFG